MPQRTFGNSPSAELIDTIWRAARQTPFMIELWSFCDCDPLGPGSAYPSPNPRIYHQKDTIGYG